MNPGSESGMERVNLIWNHSLYQEAYRKIQELEQERPFCGHSAEHFLDVARLAWIYNLEDGSGLDKECVYAAALLHDIGRHLQYLQGIPHPDASAELAAELLPQCGFSSGEAEEILCAIRSHRESGIREEKSLRGYLYKADKLSRICLACPAAADCDWPEDKKNRKIVY